ncbi:MAG: hypothetical protein ACRDZ3_15110 [Acidimicrobiia bacterium]
MRHRTARAVAAGTLVAISVVGAVAGGVVPAAGAAPPGPVERVLIVSLPGVTWADVTGAEAPRLRALIAGSAVASMSLRVFHRSTPAAEGYATIGAGALLNGHRRLGARAGPDEDGGIVSPAAPILRALNAERRRGAEVGALGDALAGAGVTRAVVANADTSMNDPDEASWHREAVLALAGADGRVPSGVVDRSLLAADPAAPFGVRLDPRAVDDAVRDGGPGRSVVVVEASDVARAQRAGRDLAPARRRALVASALAATDAVLAPVLDAVDERMAVIVVTPSTAPGDAHLGVAALRAPGVSSGLLRSSTTRRSGLVALADVAPTVLALLDLPVPVAMEGGAFEVGREGPASLGGLVQDNREARLRDRLVVPVTRSLVATGVALALAGALTLTGRLGRRTRAAVAFGSLWMLGMLGMAWLPAAVDVATVGGWWSVVIGGGMIVAALATRFGRTPLARLSVPLGLLVVLLLTDVVTGAGFQLSAVFGYSPTAGGRYSGIGNLAFAQLAAAGALLAAVVAHRIGGRRGAWAGVGLLVAVLVVDGLPSWGADVGGVLAGLPGFAVIGAGLLGARLSLGGVVGIAGLAVVAVAALGALDLLRPPAARTHLGRLLDRMGDEGLTPLRDVVARKSELAWDLFRPAARRWLPLAGAGLAFVAFAAYGPRAGLRRLRAGMPQLGPAVTGALVVAVLGFALNDSGVAIPAMTLGVLTPALLYLTLEWEA